MELDFGDVKSGPPDEGIYTLRVSDVEVRPTKNNPENKNLNFEYTIVEPEEWMNWKVWDNVSLTPQARWRLQQVLEAITGEEWREDSMTLDPRDLLGKEFQASLMHNLYEGRKNAKIKDYFGPEVQPESGFDATTLFDTPSSEEEPF